MDSPSREYTCRAFGVAGKANTMRKRYVVIATAWLLHLASWFLPAIKGFLGSSLDHGIPGWDVFLGTTCALWLLS